MTEPIKARKRTPDEMLLMYMHETIALRAKLAAAEAERDEALHMVEMMRDADPSIEGSKLWKDWEARAAGEEEEFLMADTVTTLEGGEQIFCHAQSVCAGQTCCVHNRSDHSMREFPQHWRDDRKIMERICPHGIGHPDPDDPTEDRVHGCDGCCSPN